MKLWMKILIGIALGILAGALLRENAIYLKPLGTIFLSLIGMIVPLLILSSVAIGVTNIHDPATLGRVGGRTMLIYFITTFIAISIGIFLANLFALGSTIHLDYTEIAPSKPLSMQEVLLSIIPTNPIAALVSGNIVQIIVFAMLLGLAINFSGQKGKPLNAFLESLADVMYRLTSLVMTFAPIGIFGITAWVAGSFGITVLIPLLKFLGVYYLACAFQMFGVYGFLLKVLARLPLLPFFKGMGDTIMMAFSTGSSAASLPVALHCVQENLGASKNIAGFVLPLGITMNMNGTAIFLAMSSVFIAKVYNIPLDFAAYFKLVLTATLSAIGTAGVPGAGFIMLSTVLTSLGLPLEGLALLAGIDRVRDMVTTVLNILGDAAVTIFVAKMEGELDEQKYHNLELVKFNSN